MATRFNLYAPIFCLEKLKRDLPPPIKFPPKTRMTFSLHFHARSVTRLVKAIQLCGARTRKGQRFTARTFEILYKPRPGLRPQRQIRQGGNSSGARVCGRGSAVESVRGRLCSEADCGNPGRGFRRNPRFSLSRGLELFPPCRICRCGRRPGRGCKGSRRFLAVKRWPFLVRAPQSCNCFDEASNTPSVKCS